MYKMLLCGLFLFSSFVAAPAAFAQSMACGLHPMPPLGCKWEKARCVCDENGHCKWVFEDCI